MCACTHACEWGWRRGARPAGRPAWCTSLCGASVDRTAKGGSGPQGASETKAGWGPGRIPSPTHLSFTNRTESSQQGRHRDPQDHHTGELAWVQTDSSVQAQLRPLLISQRDGQLGGSSEGMGLQLGVAQASCPGFRHAVTPQPPTPGPVHQGPMGAEGGCQGKSQPAISSHSSLNAHTEDFCPDYEM